MEALSQPLSEQVAWLVQAQQTPQACLASSLYSFDGLLLRGRACLHGTQHVGPELSMQRGTWCF